MVGNVAVNSFFNPFFRWFYVIISMTHPNAGKRMPILNGFVFEQKKPLFDRKSCITAKKR